VMLGLIGSDRKSLEFTLAALPHTTLRNTHPLSGVLPCLNLGYGLHSWKRGSLTTFNTKITHLRDVLPSIQEYRAWLEKAQPAQSGRGYEARSQDTDGRLRGTGRASSATGYPPRSEEEVVPVLICAYEKQAGQPNGGGAITSPGESPAL
jgi:hypothetical protein